MRVPQLRQWQDDEVRTTYLLDVRSREEFEAGHLAGARHAPGGQMVQAMDEFVAVRNARVVLVDPERVRSVMTASWLNQMGWEEVYVLEAEGDFGFGDLTLARGPRTPRIPAYPDAPAVRAAELAQRLGAGAVLIDLSSSLRFRRRHVPGAWWAVRARLAAAREKIGAAKEIVLTSDDGLLARLAAPEAAALWPGVAVQVLGGGNAAWFDAGLPAQTGIERATTAPDDVWYKPYDHEQEQDYEKHARAYLDWELGLVEQIKRDPAIRFRAYDTHA